MNGVEFPKTFLELLQALQGPGAVLLVLWAASWGAEEFQGWQNLPPKIKSLSVLGVSVGIGLFSVWFGTHPVWVAAAEPYIKVVLAISGSWIGTQAAYRVKKALA